MESKWRWNVWDMGWQHGPFGLIARLGPGWNIALTDRPWAEGFTTVIFLSPGPDPNWVEGGVGPGIKLAPRFPYGWNVEPD